MNIQWKRNEFRTFYATMKIRVGNHSGNGSGEIQKGDEIEYDGTIVKYSGLEFQSTQLRSAVEKGWIVLDPDQTNSTPSTHVASRAVAKSNMKTSDLSKVQRTQIDQMDHDYHDEDTVLRVGDRADAMDHQRQGHLTPQNNRRIAANNANMSDGDTQEYIHVNRIRTSPKIVSDVTSQSSSKLSSQLNNISYENGFGRGVDKKPVIKEGITITSNSSMNKNSVVEQEGDGDYGVVVGQVRHTDKQRTSSGDISISDTSNIRSRKVVKKTVKKTGKKLAKNVVEGKFAKPAVNTNSNEFKLKIAKKIYAKFPTDWNFFGKLDEKMKILKRMGAPSEMVVALHASEGSGMKKLLEKTYPQHLS